MTPRKPRRHLASFDLSRPDAPAPVVYRHANSTTLPITRPLPATLSRS